MRSAPARARLPRHEWAVVALLAAAVSAPQLELVIGGTTIGMDSATAFYPWYAFLGQRLRAGALPAWNPAQFSGTPFAADPESGWMYLAAMVLFTALPLAQAAPAYPVFHTCFWQAWVCMRWVERWDWGWPARPSRLWRTPMAAS
jgi:hypothetical protein